MKSKFLYLNLIALLILVLQYFMDNSMFQQYFQWEGLALVILNALAGMIQFVQNRIRELERQLAQILDREKLSNQVVKLKKTLAKKQK